MKRILAATIFIIVFGCSFGFCDEYIIDAMSKEKLQLDVTMRFNAIEPAMAIKIMDHLRMFYGHGAEIQDACKLEYSISSPLVNITGGLISDPDRDSDDGSSVIFHALTGGKCYGTIQSAIRYCDDGYIDTEEQPGRYCCK